MADQTFQHIKLTMQGGRADIELCRPGKRNALLPSMLAEISQAVDIASRRSEIKCLVISGRGDHFCAGMDVTARLEGKDTKADWLSKRDSIAALNKLSDAPAVTICRLDGYVVGAGILIAAACKLRYATPETRFYVPELNMGIPFSLGAVAALSRYLGITRVAEMVLTCNKIEAASEYMAGFVTRVIDRDHIDAHIGETAESIASRPNVLLLSTLSTLREAERALIPDAASDLFTMLFANMERESGAVRDNYGKRFGT